MSLALHHFLNSATYSLRIVFCIVVLYRIWPRKRHWRQGFKKLTPEGIPVDQMPNYFDFRSRLVLCAFMSVGLLFVLGDQIRRTFLPTAAPQAVPVEAAQPPRTKPRIVRSSAARAGDKVEILCGTSVCGIASTAQAAQELASHPKGTGRGTLIKSGTEAIVTLYDPDFAQMDTAKVYVVPDDTDPRPAVTGWVPGKWMHKLPEQSP